MVIDFSHLQDRNHPILILIKILVAGFFIYSALRTHKKSRSILNSCFASAFFAWALYNILDVIVLFISPLSYSAFITGQILWRLQTLMIFVYTFFIYNTASIIQSGEFVMKSKSRNLMQGGFLALGYVFIAIFASISIEESATDRVLNPLTELPPTVSYTIRNGFGVNAIAFIIPIAFFLLASYHLIKVAQAFDGTAMKQRVYFTLLGNLMIPLGLVYFLLRGILVETTLFNSILGQVFFLLSPIFILIAQKSATQPETENGN